MILLDTSVVSEPLKPSGEPAVLAWIDAQAVETLYLSTISLAELRFGIAVMADGRRKDDLRLRLLRVVRHLPLRDASRRHGRQVSDKPQGREPRAG